MTHVFPGPGAAAARTQADGNAVAVLASDTSPAHGHRSPASGTPPRSASAGWAVGSMVISGAGAPPPFNRCAVGWERSRNAASRFPAFASAKHLTRRHD